MGISSFKDCPVWLTDFVESLINLITPSTFIGEIGFCYLSPEKEKNKTNRWVIAVYLLPYELSGGGKDGAHVLPEFSLDLSAFLKKFSKVDAISWKVTRNFEDGFDGPKLLVEGVYQKTKKLQFHFYTNPPASEKPSVVFDVKTMECRPKQK